MACTGDGRGLAGIVVGYAGIKFGVICGCAVAAGYLPLEPGLCLEGVLLNVGAVMLILNELPTRGRTPRMIVQAICLLGAGMSLSYGAAVLIGSFPNSQSPGLVSFVALAIGASLTCQSVRGCTMHEHHESKWLSEEMTWALLFSKEVRSTLVLFGTGVLILSVLLPFPVIHVLKAPLETKLAVGAPIGNMVATALLAWCIIDAPLRRFRS